MNKKEIEALREDYRLGVLNRQDLGNEPISQFKAWFEAAVDSKVPEPNVFTLATATASGIPSARILLLKDIRPEGFVFYTNTESQKGLEMRENPHAAMVFLWLELQRQVRIEGTVERLSEEDSIRYFQSRPKGSQIGAWASPQSNKIDDRIKLEEKVEQLKLKYASVEKLPKPPNWGGYLVRPTVIEFWQGRSSRLHDRFVFRQGSSNDWTVDRLAP